MPHVIVVGGGYGGLRAIEFLAASGEFDITLLDKNTFHYMQTEAYGYIAGRFDLHDVAIDLKNWCAGFKPHVRFIHDEVVHSDYADRVLHTASGQLLEFDYLIIAVGAQTNFFSFIPGLREHSHGVKQLQRAFDFRVHFESLIYDKLQHPVDDTAQPPLQIVIAGAGLSGVEIAAEMADVLQKHERSIGDSAKQIRISLVDAAPTILPGMSDYIIRQTTKRLESLGIALLTEAFIDRVEPDRIHLKNTQIIPYDFMIFTGGISGVTLSSSLQYSANRIGQYVVDDHLRICDDARVFAVGDCAELKDRKGNLLPPTAQTAEKSAEYAAKAILAMHRGKQPAPFNAKVDGVFVALGGQYAVGELFGIIRVQGYLAYLLKKTITTSYYLGLKLRVNVGYKNRKARM